MVFIGSLPKDSDFFVDPNIVRAATLASEIMKGPYSPYNLRGSYPLFGPSMRTKRGRVSYNLKGCKRTKSRTRSVISQKYLKVPTSTKTILKNVDVNYALSVSAAASASFANIGGVPTGSINGTRHGNDTRVLQLYVTLSIIGSDNIKSQHFRVLIVRSKTGNDGSAPAISNILTLDPDSNYTPLSLRNIDTINDYEILLDKMINITDNDPVGTQNSAIYNFKIDTCFPQKYNGTTATSVSMNPVHMYVVTDQTATSTSAVAKGSIRVMYSDI